MTLGIYNLHNHTPFSDGAYTIDEIVEAHLDCDALAERELLGIGISDHLFCTPSSREVNNDKEYERVFGKEARSYVTMVHEARQRWVEKVPIYCGAEINWPLNKGRLETIRGMLDGIDYVLFEYVDWAGLTQLANQARRWPCPVILAHTDVTVAFPNTSMDQVVRTLANARIVYEANSKQMPLTEHDRWYKVLPNHRVYVSVGTDTHDDLAVLEDLPKMHDYLESRGLSEKVFVPQVRGVEQAAAAR